MLRPQLKLQIDWPQILTERSMPKKLSVVAQNTHEKSHLIFKRGNYLQWRYFQTRELSTVEIFSNEGIIYSGDIFNRGNYLQWRYFK